MNNIEQNALRIAELLGWNPDSRDNNVYNIVIENRGPNEWLRQPQYAVVKTFSSYNGLMPLVFECNAGFNTVAIIINEDNVQLLNNNKYVEFDHGDGGIYYDANDDEPLEFLFIEKIQLACIKYLELKNA